MSGRRRRRLRSVGRTNRAGLIVIAILALSGGAAFVLARGQGSQALSTRLTVLGLGLAAATAYIAWVTFVSARQAESPQTRQLSLADAADRLAEELSSEWEVEERKRRINDPYAMPVRWRVRKLPSAAALEASLRGSAKPRGDLSGSFKEILQAFDQSPLRRLIIIGAAGAGKTVLATQLAIQLTGDVRRPGGAVPFILSASTWSPGQRLHEWIVGQLIYQRKWLAEKPGAREVSFAEALARDHIIPIIDGLDELPEHLRARAIEAINLYGSKAALVVTSREEEYVAAVAADRGVTLTSEVEVLPLSVQDVKEYLYEATRAGREARWDYIVQCLEADERVGKKRPLTAALTTPLMLWLARTIYGQSEKDPSELVNGKLFNDEQAIQRHLIEGLIPAVYDRQTGLSQFGCTSDQAQRWLAFLAAHTRSSDSNNLEWWTLVQTVRRSWSVGVATRAALLFVTAWWLLGAIVRRYHWQHGIKVNEILTAGPTGRHLLPYATHIQEWLRRPAARSFRSGMEAVISFLLQHSPVPFIPLVILGGFFVGILSSLILVPISPRTLGMPIATVVRVVANIVLSLAAACVLVLVLPSIFLSGAWSALLHRSSIGWPILLVALWMLVSSPSGIISRPGASNSISARGLLRRDRNVVLFGFIGEATAKATLIWLFFGPVVAFAYVSYKIIGLFCRVVLGSDGSASAQFEWARLWLTCTRRTPWRLIPFLDDAVRTGVLQPVGSAYQFRHIMLQQQLARQSGRTTRRIADFLVRHCVGLIEFLDEWDFTDWWWWWSYSSAGSWSEPLWSLRFETVAQVLEDQIGEAIEDPHREGPGIVQPFHGIDHPWIMCARWHGYPSAVAKPVWDELRRASPGPAGDEFSTMGFPDIDPIVPADAKHVKLRGGSWGQGLLLRDPDADTWRWQPEIRIGFVPPEEWPEIKLPPPPLRVRVEVFIPWTPANLSITKQTHDELAKKLRHSELARIIRDLLPAEAGVRTQEQQKDGGIIWTISGPLGMAALSAEVTFSIANNTESSALTAAAEIRIEDFKAWRDARCGSYNSLSEEDNLRLSLNDLLDFYSAAWHFFAVVIPTGIVGDIKMMKYAGQPRINILLSAARPMDLLFFRTRVDQKLQRGDNKKLISLMMKGKRIKRLEHGDLNDFIDFSPFKTQKRRSSVTELSARIVAPLSLDSEDRQRLVREATAYMIEGSVLKTSDPEWSDTIASALHTAHRR